MGYCDWAAANERSRAYHDSEWGVPVHDERRMFEHLSLECLQCGLSWDLMLKKREIFRACFAGFDYETVAAFSEEDAARILQTEGMLRAPRKIAAVIENARRCLDLRAEVGGLCEYFWSFTDGKTVLYDGHETGPIPVSNALSERIARDLKRRGFRYVGPVTVYSHLQACGIINDHGASCPCRARIMGMQPTARKPRDGEVM